MNKPKVRFNGFTDDWKQRKMCDVFQEYSEKNHPELPPLTIIQGGGTILREESDRYLQYNKDSLSNYKMVRKDDFIVHLRSFEGGLEKATCDGIISPAYRTFHGENIDARFYYQFFRSKKFIEVLLKPHVYGIRDGKSIDIEGMKTIEIPVTSYKEQKRIGDYIEFVDSFITIHQSKLIKLINFKTTMLQKLFPKSGAKAPEIRFKGFTYDWEQQKVGDYLTESREIGHTGDVARKMTVKLWGRGVFEKDTVGSSNTQYFIRHKNQFIYSKLDFLNCAFGVVPDKLDSFETTADVPAFDCVGINPHFMYYTAIQPQFYERNGLIADGSRKAKRIHADAFCNMPIAVPSIEEQNKIVSVMQQLDNAVALYQRKLIKLQNVKKSLLASLFI